MSTRSGMCEMSSWQQIAPHGRSRRTLLVGLSARQRVVSPRMFSDAITLTSTLLLLANGIPVRKKERRKKKRKNSLQCPCRSAPALRVAGERKKESDGSTLQHPFIINRNAFSCRLPEQGFGEFDSWKGTGPASPCPRCSYWRLGAQINLQ